MRHFLTDVQRRAELHALGLRRAAHGDAALHLQGGRAQTVAAHGDRAAGAAGQAQRQTVLDVEDAALLDDHQRMMILAIHNSDVSDGWEREGEDELYFTRYSERIAYPLGINIILYLMTH